MMERILVTMGERHGAWEALSHALFLAKRISAKVYVLLVLEPAGREPAGGATTRDGAVRRRLELLIESAKADGVNLDYFVAEGVHEVEVIQFIEQHRITLLIAEGGDGDGKSADRETAASLRKILHRVSCRVELVTPRKTGPSPAMESS